MRNYARRAMVRLVCPKCRWTTIRQPTELGYGRCKRDCGYLVPAKAFIPGGVNRKGKP